MVHIQTSQYNFNFGFMSLQGTHKVHIQIANMILNVADISKYSPISTISESEYHLEDSSRESNLHSFPFNQNYFRPRNSKNIFNW